MEEKILTTHKDILLKSWELVQNLISSYGILSNKIQLWGLGGWAILIFYSYKEKDIVIAIFAIFIIIILILIEARIKQMEYAYIEKSLEIEKVLNDILVEDPSPILPDRGISTNIDTPSFKDFKKLFIPKRWLFWGPYIGVFIITILLIIFLCCIYTEK